MERRAVNPYMFETWSRDVMMWTLCTSTRQNQQATAIAMRLGGAARECARELTPAELTHGGLVGTPPNQQHVDPVTYLISHLTLRFAPLAEETMIRAVSDLETFSRRPGETTDSLLTRFESTLTRARTRGNLATPYQHVAWILLRAVGVSPQQLMLLLNMSFLVDILFSKIH